MFHIRFTARHFSGLGLLLTAFAALLFVAEGADAQGPKGGGPRKAAALAGTAFTYQGQLKKSGALVTGSCNFTFNLYSDAGGVSLVAGPVAGNPNPATVTSGLFTEQIDFGGTAFTGDARWLQTIVQCTGDGSPTPLSLQPLTPAPIAFSLPGLYTQQNLTSPNVIGGYSGNSVGPSIFGATIGGGGTSGNINQVLQNYGTIGGGYGNTIPALFGLYATIGGGVTNTASEQYAVIGGGSGNIASGTYSTISGGSSNLAAGKGSFIGGGGFDGSNFMSNSAAGNGSTIAGGLGNHIPGSGQYSTIGGGSNNAANDWFATVGGGVNNAASGKGAFVGGGGFNGTVSGGNTASGTASTIPGGFGNSATMTYTFAAGRRAKAVNQGGFVWGDSTDQDFSSTANDQFLIRANGGMGVNTNNPATNTLTVGGNGLRVGIDGTTLKRVQAGQVNLGSGIAGVNVYTITFPTAFNNLPTVYVTPNNDPNFDSGNDNDTFALTIRRRSTTQFVVNVLRVDTSAGWDQSLKLNWYAVE